MTRFVHPLLLLIVRFTNKELAQVTCHDSLGGLLKHHERIAA
jgi:hypothetical protein